MTLRVWFALICDQCLPAVAAFCRFSHQGWAANTMESVVMEGMYRHCSVMLAGWNVDDWLREPVWEPAIQTQTVLSNRVFGGRKRGFRCLLHHANAPVCVCGLMQRNTQTKCTTTANDQCLERRAFSGQAECCCQDRDQVRGHPGVV